MPASHSSVRKVYFSTTEITTVDISAATYLGTLSGDSDTPEPEVMTDDFLAGKAETGATVDYNIRMYGTGGAALTTLQTAKDANPPTELWFYFPNQSNTSVSRVGPATVYQAGVLPNSATRRRKSFRVRFSAQNDTSELVAKTVDGTVVLPS